jgi:hypothetical protein
VVESLRKSGESFFCMIQARDKPLESLESDIRKLKVELDKKDDIIYSHKQHNNQDHNAGNWSQLHINQDHTHENDGIWSQVQYKCLDINESKTPQNKPEILLIGTSSTKVIQPEKNSSSYVLRKKEAMTLADTEKTVSEIRDAPGALVLHSLTNDLKESAPTCCSPMKNIITNIQESMSNTKVVVSLATPRADDKKFQPNVELVNAMLKCEYMGDDIVTLCDNGNLSHRGHPVPKFLANDQYHLSKDDIAVLASNIRTTVDGILSIKHITRLNISNNRREQQGSSNPRFCQHSRGPPKRRK